MTSYDEIRELVEELSPKFRLSIPPVTFAEVEIGGYRLPAKMSPVGLTVSPSAFEKLDKNRFRLIIAFELASHLRARSWKKRLTSLSATLGLVIAPLYILGFEMQNQLALIGFWVVSAISVAVIGVIGFWLAYSGGDVLVAYVYRVTGDHEGIRLHLTQLPLLRRSGVPTKQDLKTLKKRLAFLDQIVASKRASNLEPWDPSQRLGGNGES